MTTSSGCPHSAGFGQNVRAKMAGGRPETGANALLPAADEALPAAAAAKALVLALPSPNDGEDDKDAVDDEADEDSGRVGASASPETEAVNADADADVGGNMVAGEDADAGCGLEEEDDVNDEVEGCDCSVRGAGGSESTLALSGKAPSLAIARGAVDEAAPILMAAGADATAAAAGGYRKTNWWPRSPATTRQSSRPRYCVQPASLIRHRRRARAECHN
jgi:hypothetical protein